jgi:hypothetical protein
MSTLVHTTPAFAPAAREVKEAPRKPLWRRMFDALIEARQRRAEREIASFLASRGGILTDEAEREIMRRLAYSPARPL